MFRTLAVACLLAVLVPGRSIAQCAPWQSGFNAPGFDGPIRASLAFDDGSGMAVYVAGSFTRSPSTSAVGIARWNGLMWAQVGGGLSGDVMALTVFNDGTGPRLFAAVALSTGFGTSSTVQRWDGTQWAALGPSVPWQNSGSGMCFATFDAGSGAQLYVGGGFSPGVMRWNGSTWVAVGPSLLKDGFEGPADVNDLLVFDDGNGLALYVGGNFRMTGSGQPLGPNCAKLTGSTWTTVGGALGSGYEPGVADLTVFDDGNGRKLIAGGTFVPDFSPAFGLARLENGVWVPFASDVDRSVRALRAIDPVVIGLPPGLYVGGSFDAVGGAPANDVALWNGATWGTPWADPVVASVSTFATYDLGAGPRLLAGDFDGGVRTFDGTSWTGLGTPGGGTAKDVQSFASIETAAGERELYVGGAFATFAGNTAEGLARFSGREWHGEDFPNTAVVSQVRVANLGSGDEVYVTGRFLGFGPTTVNVLRRTNGAWLALPAIPILSTSDYPEALVAYDAGGGAKLYAGTRKGWWRLDGASWTLLFTGTSAGFSDALVVDEPSGPVLYIAGFLHSSSGPVYDGVARFDGTTLTQLGSVGFSYAMSLCRYDEGTGPALFAAGTFTTIGGVPFNGVARWDGSAWSPLGTGLVAGVTAGWARAIAVHDDHTGFGPELVVGGYFTSAGGVAANCIARWNGTTWRDPTGGMSSLGSNAQVHALHVFDRGDGRGEALFVGGLFTHAGGVESKNIAVWESCAGAAQTLCHGDGSGAACPCANESAVLDRAGCKNSLGVGATLRASGLASLSQDSLFLEGGGMGNSFGIYYRGGGPWAGGAGLTYADGLLCLTGPYLRFPVTASVQGVSRYPGPSDPRVSVVGQLTTTGDSFYQIWYRNAPAFCTPATFSYSNALRVTYGP